MDGDREPTASQADAGGAEERATEGEGRSARVVAGVTIERGMQIPPLNPWSSLAKAVKAMEVGESFLCDSEKDLEKARQAAARLGIKICRRKIAGEGWRVWRTA